MNQVTMRPDYFWPVIACFIAIVVGIILISLMGLLFKEKNSKLDPAYPFFGGLAGLFIGVITAFSLMEQPFAASNCLIVDNNGKVILEVPNGYSVWVESLDDDQHVVRRHQMLFAVASTIEPITSNPKVRHISYEVSVKLSDRPDALEDYASKLEFPFTEGSKSFIDSTLYDFNEHRSKDLAMFYNPLRPEQQKQFEKLVREEIADKLEEVGLEIVQVKFSLP